MASQDPDDNCNTETEEETIAAMKKRARRVSFAETTAVHFFDRDEESGKTPPDAGSTEDEFLRRSENEEFRAILQANGISIDDEDDDDLVPARKSFFRPFESPSPASSTFGSATPNDEENFFGPISADFIQSGLSNLAGDDENHDITMDSATFSMHFRSLARSDSGGEIKIPTGFRLAFGENSQTQTTASNIGNSMVLTMVKSPIVHSSPAVERITGSCNSNDMSLVNENSNRYDYGQLSPGLDALLAEGQEDVKAVPSPSQLKGSISVDCPKKENKADGVYQNGIPLKLVDHTPTIPTEPISLSHAHKEEANVPYPQSPADQRMQDISFIEERSPMNENLNICTKPIQMEDFSAGQESIRDAEKQRKRKAEFDQLGTLSDLNSENQVESLLTGSISSLNAKRREILKDLTSSSDHHWNSTHLQKQQGSFHNKGSNRIIFSLPLGEKSISRLKRLKPSPFASLYEDGINHIRATISGNVSKSYSKNSILDGERLNHQFRHLDVPVACLEERFSSAGRDCEKKDMNNMHINDFPMLGQHVAMRQSVRVANVSEDDRPSIPATGSMSSKEGMVAGASPSHITSLGKQELEHLSSTDNAAEVNLFSSGSDSSLIDVTLNDGKYDKVLPMENGSINNFKTLLETPNQSYATSLSKDSHSIANPNTAYGSTPVTEEELVTSETKEFQQSLMETPKQPLTVILCEGGKSIENVKVTDNATSESENPGLLIDCGMSESVLAFKLKQFVNVSSEIKIDGQKTVIKNPQLNVQTPVRNGVSEQCQLSNSVKSIRTASRTTLGEEHPMGSKSHREEQYVQLSTDEPCISAHDNEVLELRRTDDLILDSNQLRLQNASSNLQNTLDTRDDYYSSKMRNLDGKLGADMEEAVDILHKYQNSLNESNQAGKFHIGCDGISRIMQNTRGDKGPRNLTDIFKNFNLLMDKWFSSSVVKLDTHSVEKLQDVTANLQKFAASKIICSEIYSKNVPEEFDHTQLKRVADTKLLMYKAMYGKVKMQLMHLKKKRLTNQIEFLQSAVQESKLLKSKCCCKLHGSGQQYIEAGGCSNSQSCFTNQDKNKAMGGSISILKQALEDSEREKENLINFFHASLKIPKKPSGDKTIAFVMDRFKKKAPCWFLLHELQLWEVDNAENKNGQLDLVLNYDGIISQRFKLKHKPKTSISISSELINTRISKTWPNMSATTAFEFAMSGKTTLKYTGPGIFARETQRISSLLSNLYDVLEETKLAQIEPRNLAKSSFQLISVGRLDLQLTFINYNDGRRVVLSFDMSCLSCGVYPSEIIPYEVRETSSGKQKPISQSMLDEIKAAIAGLRGGYVRLLRLCRCVSNVIEAGSSRR